MTPEFAKAVDPVFLRVLDLLERAGSSASPTVENERFHIEKLLNEAEAKLGQSEEWKFAKYALVAWVDEVLIDAGFGGEWWVNNPLEFHLFRTRDRADRFYEEARRAGEKQQRNALEVFYLSVVLGFRGFYRQKEQAELLAHARHLPPTLESWAKQTSAAIRLGQGRPAIEPPRETSQGAPPLPSKSLVIWSLLAGVVLAGFVAVLLARGEG